MLYPSHLKEDVLPLFRNAKVAWDWDRYSRTKIAALVLLQLSLISLLGLPATGESSELDRIEQRIANGTVAKDDTDKLTAFCQSLKDDPRPHILLGKLYSGYNFGELASQEFETALRLDNSQPEVWILLINEKYRHTKLADAEKILREAEKIHPANPRLLLAKGSLLNRLNRAADAEACLQKARSLKPADPLIYCALSEAQYNQAHYAEALKSAERALELSPGYPDAYLCKAEALLKLRRDKEALSALSSGYVHGPFHKELITLYLSESERQGDHLVALEAALGRMGLDVNLDHLLGDDKDKVIDMIDFCQSKGVAEAEILQKIRDTSDRLRGTGHQGKFLFCLGDIYDAFGKPAQAMAFYREGLQVEPTYGRAWLRLGKDLELTHQNEEALECYLKASKYRKEDPEVVQSLAKLKARRNDWAWQLKEMLWKIFNQQSTLIPAS
jgi:tetratricopeptide (TPR) repeat protein